MRSGPLGETGLTVTRLGLGLAALGRPGYINLGHADDLAGQYSVLAMEARAHRVLDAAWAAGIRWFDAARSYGRAERFLGSWLVGREVAPEEVLVSSKWGYVYTAGWEVEAEVHEVKHHTLGVLCRQIVETRAMVGAHLDLWQVHSATLESGVLDDARVLDELHRLKSTGLRIGLTLSGPAQAETLRRALRVEVGGERLFQTVQATWNPLEPAAGEALAEARAEGMGVLVKEALANGRLTGRNDDPAFAGRMRLLREEAERLGCTVDAWALAAALARPWADAVLSGAATPEHLASNVGATGVAWDDEAEARLAELAEPSADYWETRSALAWN